jgi:hypothetical protein
MCLSHVYGQARYYKTETHCHSSNSGDGYIAPATFLNDYKNRGYKIVFMSDHDTVTDMESSPVPGVLSINAEELSCGSHFNGLNMKRTVPACGYSHQQKVDSILAQDALVCVNHPVAPRWRITANEILALQGKLSFIEVYNPSDIYEQADDQSLWDTLLTQGMHIWGVGSGDTHQWLPLEDLWIGYSMVKVDTLTKEAVLDAMIRGDFYASTGVNISNYKVSGDTTTVSCSNCFTITFWGQNHTKLKVSNSQTATYIRQPGDKYVRAELYFDRFNKAWTQPVFYDVVTTVSNRENIQSAVVYPNPANNAFHLSYFLKEKTDLNISLFDLQGKLLRELSCGTQAGGQHDMSVDVSAFPAGAYLLKISGEGTSVSKMVTVLK